MVCMGIPESRRKATLFTITRCRHRFHRWRPLHRPLRRWAKKNGYHQDAHTLVRTFLFESTQNYMTSQPNRLVLSRLEFAVRPRGIDRGSGIGRRKKVCWCNGGISSQGRVRRLPTRFEQILPSLLLRGVGSGTIEHNQEVTTCWMSDSHNSRATFSWVAELMIGKLKEHCPHQQSDFLRPYFPLTPRGETTRRCP